MFAVVYQDIVFNAVMLPIKLDGVLDNLPHDLIYSGSQVSLWMEVWVEKKKDSHQISELYKPLSNPLVTRCMEILNMDNGQTVVGNSAMIKAKESIVKHLSKIKESLATNWVLAIT